MFRLPEPSEAEHKSTQGSHDYFLQNESFSANETKEVE